MKYVYRILANIHSLASLLVRVVGGGLYRLQARVPLSLRLFVGFLLSAAICFALWWILPQFIEWAGGHVRLSGKQADTLQQQGIPARFERLAMGARLVGIACLLAAFLAWFKRGWALAWQRVAAVAFVTLWGVLFWFAISVPTALHDFDYRIYSKSTRNEHWITLGVPVLVLSAYPLMMLVAVWLRSTRHAYTGKLSNGRSWADRLLDAFRYDQGDTRFRSSVGWAACLFLMVMLLPFLIHLIRNWGMEEPYGLIKGKGEPTVQVVVKVKKKPKKKKKLIVNRWSPYIFEQPKLDDVVVADELEEETADRYVAQVGKGGKLGRGGKGPGGWPQGMVDGKIRFIRLKYDGGDWDQDMGKGADYNLLVRFHEITGFKIAENTEHIEVNRLRRFPKDRAPPFVFMTGRGGVRLTSQEIKTLRWYCIEEGGCLFIDNGGGVFHTSVVRALRRVFPEKSLREIAFDDPIFAEPFMFRNGAPPFWHHAGNRAMGIRHSGRWVVFYHPGDVNDAWKSGHSGANEAVAEQAYQLGINVMYYTFNQYHRIHFEE